MRAFPISLLALSLAAFEVQAAPLDDAAINAAPQHYVMTLPQASVGEIAEEVLGQTLGLPVTVDPAIDAQMSFRVDGVYSPGELAREFGYRLWNLDIALIEDSSHSLVLIPTSALPEAIAAGAEVVSPLALQSEAAPTATGPTARPIVYGNRRWENGPWMGVATLVLGWLAGLVTPPILRRVRRRQPETYRDPPVLHLAAPDEKPKDADPDADLTMVEPPSSHG